MAVISRGFGARRRDSDPALPPGQYLTEDFPVLSAGPTPRVELDEWRSRLEAGGVAIESDMEWPQGGRSIYFRDPSGNSLEFTEARIWGIE